MNRFTMNKDHDCPKTRRGWNLWGSISQLLLGDKKELEGFQDSSIIFRDKTPPRRIQPVVLDIVGRQASGTISTGCY